MRNVLISFLLVCLGGLPAHADKVWIPDERPPCAQSLHEAAREVMVTREQLDQALLARFLAPDGLFHSKAFRWVVTSLFYRLKPEDNRKQVTIGNSGLRYEANTDSWDYTHLIHKNPGASIQAILDKLESVFGRKGTSNLRVQDYQGLLKETSMTGEEFNQAVKLVQGLDLSEVKRALEIVVLDLCPTIVHETAPGVIVRENALPALLMGGVCSVIGAAGALAVLAVLHTSSPVSTESLAFGITSTALFSGALVPAITAGFALKHKLEGFAGRLRLKRNLKKREVAALNLVALTDLQNATPALLPAAAPVTATPPTLALPRPVKLEVDREDYPHTIGLGLLDELTQVTAELRHRQGAILTKAKWEDLLQILDGLLRQKPLTHAAVLADLSAPLLRRVEEMEAADRDLQAKKKTLQTTIHKLQELLANARRAQRDALEKGQNEDVKWASSLGRRINDLDSLELAAENLLLGAERAEDMLAKAMEAATSLTVSFLVVEGENLTEAEISNLRAFQSLLGELP